MKNKLFITIFMGVVTVALAALCIAPKFLDKGESPVISVPYDSMTYVEGDEAQALLVGVSAYDEEDGDISDDLRVYDIAVLTDGERAAITYAVYDSDNNLAKATRIVNYLGENPEATASDAGETGEDDSSDSNIDADNDDESESGLTGEGYDDPKLESTGAPVIRLLTHEIYLEVGDDFYSNDYVDTVVDDKDSRSELFRNIYINNEDLDMDTEGDYEVEYWCVDSDDNESNVAKLMIHVGTENADEDEENEE